MNMNYHEHLQAERLEALTALKKAQEKEGDHVSITLQITPERKRILSVNKQKLQKTISKLKKTGMKIVAIGNKRYEDES